MVAGTNCKSPEKREQSYPGKFLNDILRNYSGVLERTKLSKGQRSMARKLRRHGKNCHKKGEQETRGKIRFSNPIELRSEEANNRNMIGHWEGDTVAGKTGSSCLITLTDRHSRYLLTKKVTKKTVAFVRDGMIDTRSRVPSEYVLFVTPDRGKEFSFHEQVTDAMNGMPFYFPKPYAPWERGWCRCGRNRILLPSRG